MSAKVVEMKIQIIIRRQKVKKETQIEKQIKIKRNKKRLQKIKILLK